MARPRTDIEPRIVHAARVHFVTDGVDGASLRAIARAAGTSIGMLYYYFPTKDELFLAVVEEVYSGLVGDLTSALAAGAPVEERLGRLYARIGAATDEELQVARLVFREMVVSSARLEQILARFQRGHLALIATALRDGIDQGDIDRRFPPAVLLLLTLAMGALPQLLYRRASHLGLFAALPDLETLTRLLLDALFRGVSPRTL